MLLRTIRQLCGRKAVRSLWCSLPSFMERQQRINSRTERSSPKEDPTEPVKAPSNTKTLKGGNWPMSLGITGEDQPKNSGGWRDCTAGLSTETDRKRPLKLLLYGTPGRSSYLLCHSDVLDPLALLCPAYTISKVPWWASVYERWLKVAKGFTSHTKHLCYMLQASYAYMLQFYYQI